jgi:hypothetical protein
VTSEKDECDELHISNEDEANDKQEEPIAQPMPNSVSGIKIQIPMATSNPKPIYLPRNMPGRKR